MGMVLYEMAMSPNAKRARLGLAETGAPYERREVNLLAGEQKTAGYKAIHPLGRVPTLDDDGVRRDQRNRQRKGGDDLGDCVCLGGHECSVV